MITKYPSRAFWLSTPSLLTIAIPLLVCTAASAKDHADSVDLNMLHRVMDNFGASDAWTMKGIGTCTWSDENKNRIADLLFSTDRGIGLSLWRFNIGGGTNHISRCGCTRRG